MINDYLWTTLYAQREAELRAHARRRGGDPAPPSATRPGVVGRLRLRLRRRAQAAPATTPPVPVAPVTAPLVLRAPGVRTPAARPVTPAESVREEKAA